MNGRAGDAMKFNRVEEISKKGLTFNPRCAIIMLLNRLLHVSPFGWASGFFPVFSRKPLYISENALQ